MRYDYELYSGNKWEPKHNFTSANKAESNKSSFFILSVIEVNFLFVNF